MTQKASRSQLRYLFVRLKNEFPSLPQIPVSARSECYLQELVSSGIVRYSSASGDIQCTSATSNPNAKERCKIMEENVIKR